MLTLVALRGFAQLRAASRTCKTQEKCFRGKSWNSTPYLLNLCIPPQKKVAHMTCSFCFGGGRKVPPYRTVLMVIYCTIFLGGAGTPRIQVGTSIKEKLSHM